VTSEPAPSLAGSPDATTAEGGEVFRIMGLVKRYGKRTVLDGLDWTVPAGTVFGLIGRNGAGKTTLLRCLLGLSPVDAGEIRVLGADVARLDGARLHRLGYVPQTFDLFPWMKVDAYLDFTRAFYARWDEDLVRRLAEEWRIPWRAKISTLSQGERQMLAIVRALAPDPDLLVLDEPVASLDPVARREFLATLVPLVRRPGKTVVLSTHIVRDLERLEAGLALLRDGRIVFTLAPGAHEGHLALARLRRPEGFAGVSTPEGALAARVRSDGALDIVYENTGDVGERLRVFAEREGASLESRPIDLEDLFVALA